MNRTLLVISAFVLAACSQGETPDAKRGDAKAGGAIVVAAIKVAPRPVPIDFEAVGRTEGSREVQVRARVSGILEAQLFTEGDTVKAGTPLFRIERVPFEIDPLRVTGPRQLRAHGVGAPLYRNDWESGQTKSSVSISARVAAG